MRMYTMLVLSMLIACYSNLQGVTTGLLTFNRASVAPFFDDVVYSENMFLV